MRARRRPRVRARRWPRRGGRRAAVSQPETRHSNRQCDASAYCDSAAPAERTLHPKFRCGEEREQTRSRGSRPMHRNRTCSRLVDAERRRPPLQLRIGGHRSSGPARVGTYVSGLDPDGPRDDGLRLCRRAFRAVPARARTCTWRRGPCRTWDLAADGHRARAGESPLGRSATMPMLIAFTLCGIGVVAICYFLVAS